MNLAPFGARFTIFFHLQHKMPVLPTSIQQLGNGILDATSSGVVESGLIGTGTAHVQVGIDILHGAGLRLAA